MSHNYKTHIGRMVSTLSALAASLVMSATLTGAAQGQDQALVDAAQGEGKLSIYANIDPGILQGLADAFQEKYNITVDVQRQSSSALAQRFMAERESGINIADIYYSTDQAFHVDGVKAGIFAALDDVPGISTWPAEAVFDGYVILGYNPYSLVWNTDLVAEGLDSWEDLADPQWAGQVMLTDPRSGVTSNQFYKMLRDAYGDDFLRRLGKNATYSKSAVPGMQQVAAGAQAMYAPGIHQVAVGLIAKGAPLQEAFPEPTISSNNLMSLVADAPNPNAAKLFMSFLTTVEGQQLNNPDGFPPIEGVPGARNMPKVVVIDPAIAQAESDEMAKLMGL